MFAHGFNCLEVITLNSLFPAQTFDRESKTVYLTRWHMIKTFQSRINQSSFLFLYAICAYIRHYSASPKSKISVSCSFPLHLHGLSHAFCLSNIGISHIHLLLFLASIPPSLSFIWFIIINNFATGLLVSTHL